ncbi:MAG: 1-(5-phosphoribosyl)-5-[(5-phosphoribosylamino)methylideneamino]imidazole-4-carboxamide isomerase [Chloroflexota bacterium]|nr:1-(5-phosphoribosyl)-5-[(5-phosphoribosylamino)methylideneamino]imidazole-4-carboxamide isomerase [Chloroflexota bacterium]
MPVVVPGARTSPFDILPSIDVRAGRVVDLYQGDYAQETVYTATAEGVAGAFVRDGARWIHVVDLDGSRHGRPANRELVQRIAALAGAAGVKLELGGGIRSLDAARAALDAGAARVIFGTAAVERPQLVAEAVSTFGAPAVVVGIDARDGMVATRGWTQASPRRAIDLAKEMIDLGATRFIYTDIARDSTLTEPNFAELEALARAVSGSVIASGGVTTTEQVARLARLPLEGAIIGSALYAGKITLPEALAAASSARRDDVIKQ